MATDPDIDPRDAQAAIVLADLAGAHARGDVAGFLAELADGAVEIARMGVEGDAERWSPILDAAESFAAAMKDAPVEVVVPRGLVGKDGRVLRREASLAAAMEDETTCASTARPDRYEDIVDVQTLKLDNYAANPIMPWGHDYREPAIGNAKGIRVDGVNAEARLLFAPVFHELTDLSKKVAALWKAGVLKTVSIGFLPCIGKGDTVARSMLPKEHWAYGERGIFFRNAELLEISPVNIPANPGASKLSWEPKLTIDKGFLDEVAGKVAERIEAARIEAARPKVSEPGDWFSEG